MATTKTRKTSKAKGPKADAFQKQADAIIAIIEAGQADPEAWTAPWRKLSTAPRNAATGKAYQGGNWVVFALTAAERGWSPIFATRKQWNDLGCIIRKGEHGTPGAFYSRLPTKDDPEVFFFLARGFHVFSVDQVVDMDDKPGSRDKVLAKYRPADLSEPEQVAGAEAFFAAYHTGARVGLRWGGEQAFYHRGTDHVQLPNRDRFTTTEGLYSTWAHEVGHSTGAQSRLARTFGDKFADPAYALEELVAELTSALLCGHLGIEAEPRQDHLDYLAHWARALRAQPTAFHKAAGYAQAATAYAVEQAEAAPVAEAA